MFIKAWLRLILLVLLAWGQGAVAAPDYELETSASGPVLWFVSTELAFGEGYKPPVTGWEKRPLPALRLNQNAVGLIEKPPTVWLRFHFDKATMRPGPLALGLDHMSERFIINLNGVDIHRNYPDEQTVMFGWNRPWMVPLPPQLLREKDNQVTIRVDTNITWNLGIGGMRIGLDREIRADHDRRYLARIQFPQLINGIILCLSIAILLSWLTRRKEKEILWLALVGGLWWFRNLHYYVSAPPFDSALFWDLTVYSMFALMIALYGFAATFIGGANKRKVVTLFSAAGVAIIILRYVLLERNLSDMICYILTIPMAFSIIFVLGRACWQSPTLPKIMMLCALTFCILLSFHDFALVTGVWTGASFYLQPYGSITVYLVWAMALWLRLFGAMNEVEILNDTLEHRVLEAKEMLSISEAARHKLEMESALEQERERLMREIHDGIGSNLVTALGAAERQQASPETVNILRRSITDLKIAVDSLEPIEGDVAALLASFRHRIEPDLNDAGISFKWEVEAVPTLAWLDAVNALHIFRILQEAVANIVKHSGATQIRVGCSGQAHERRDGILVMLSDNGQGFDPSVRSAGRGLTNMASRALSLHGVFSCDSSKEGGTQTTVWLPLSR